MRASSLLLGLALLAPAPSALAQADPAAVVAAERAFAADGLALGIKRSFLKHAAPEAILFAPDPVKVADYFGARPDKPNPPLVWWPVWAGIARSGDLGFTSGPSTFDGKPNGWFFTVWTRQPDGGWKWVYDGGAPSDQSAAPPQGSDPVHLPPATGKAVDAATAMAGVRAAEAKLARTAASDATAAYLAVLAPDTRVSGSKAAPATTPASVRDELARRAPTITFSPLGGAASQAGDLAWTYGDANWSKDGAKSRGHYVRVWQNRTDGWRLIYDQILPVAAAGS